MCIRDRVGCLTGKAVSCLHVVSTYALDIGIDDDGYGRITQHAAAVSVQELPTFVHSRTCLLYTSPRSIPLPGFHHPGTYGSHLRPTNGVDNRSHQISSESRAYLAQQSAVRIHFQLRTICRQSGMQYSSQSCGQTTTAWRSPDKQDRRLSLIHISPYQAGSAR